MTRIVSKLKNTFLIRKLNSFKKYIGLWGFVKFSKKFRKYEEADPMTFPIVIISFNQVSFLRSLISFLRDSGYLNIVIIDNNSTYPPLLDYFEEIKEEVIIHKLEHNYGHMVFWEQDRFFRIYGKGYYVVTDADVVPDPDCPPNFLRSFKEVLDKNIDVTKVGFSLRLDNIPASNPHREKILKWEEKFWSTKDEEGNYVADIDTTFALYRPHDKNAIAERFYKAIRMKQPFQASHGGWQLDPKNLTEEQAYYMKHAKGSSSWRLDENGNIVDPKYL